MHRVTLGCAIGIFILQLFVVIPNLEFFDETIWLTLGLNALFIIVPIIRIIVENKRSKQEFNKHIEIEKITVERILDNNNLDDKEKILKIISLAKEGNIYAALLLEKLRENSK